MSTAVSLTEREYTVAAAAVNMVAVAWGGDPVVVVAVVSNEPNRTEVAAKPNQTGGVIDPIVVVEAEVGVEVEAEDGVGVALGVLEEAVLAAVLM